MLILIKRKKLDPYLTIYTKIDSKYIRYLKVNIETIKCSKQYGRDFPGGAVAKNPSANAGDMGSIPGLGRSHMPQSN